jgi:hypothetical protein
MKITVPTGVPDGALTFAMAVALATFGQEMVRL